MTESLVMSVQNVMVMTTSNRGHTPEELAEMAIVRLLAVSDSAPAAVKEQANVFRERIKTLLVYYLNEAVKQDRITLTTKLEQTGQNDLINIIRSL
jgi:hypothetical protein